MLLWPGPLHPHDVADGDMTLLSCADGKPLWHRGMMAGEPWQVAVDHEHAYVADPHLQSTAAWTAIALADGRTVWRQPQGDGPMRPSSLSRMGNVLIERFNDAALAHRARFLDPRTGREIWHSERVTSIFWNGPVLEEGVCARDLDSGRTLWNLPQSDGLEVEAGGALLGQSVYFAAHGPGSLSGTDTPAALAADRQNGQVAWRHRSQDAPYEQDWRPLAADGDVLLLERHMKIAHPKLSEHAPADQASSLIALDAANGDVAFGLWDVRSSPAAPPVRSGSTLYVLGQEKTGSTLYAIDLEKARALARSGRRWWF